MNLPIELVPNTSPPLFRWTQIAQSIIGPRTVECQGSLPPGVEDAVIKLISIAKTYREEIDSLKMEIKELKCNLKASMDRIGAQSDIITKMTEKAKVEAPQVKKSK